MGRAKKKSATKVDAASDVVPQSGKKGKRGSQNVVGKASSAKKQKVERDETLVAKQEVEKNIPKKDSELEIEPEVAAEKTPTPTKNGSALDENPKKDSTSDTSEGGESDISDDKPVAAEPTKVSDAADSGENSSEEDNTAAAAPAAVSDEKNESGDDDNEEPKVNEPQQEQEQASSKSSGSDEASGEDENVEDEDVKMADAEKSAEPNSPTSEVSVSKTLFAGNLSFSVAESDLRDFFKDVGEVVDVRLATNFDGRFKGFGHVEFATAEEAQKALELHDHSLLDRPIRLDLARARGDKSSENNSFMKKNLGEDESETPSSEASGTKTIFCGNLSFSLEESDVLEFFKDVGEVVDIRFASDPEGKFKGFGHVEFATAEAAKNALKLHDQPLLDRPIRIDLARERGDNSRDNNSTQHGGKAQTLTAFIKGFNTSLDEDEIRSELEKHFASCGKITRISIPKDYETGLVKGMAYMDFADSGGYNKALRMDNSDMGGGFCLNVEEAKPKNDNGGGRFGGRGGGGRFGGGGGRFGGRGGGRGGRRGGGRGGGRGRGRR